MKLRGLGIALAALTALSLPAKAAILTATPLDEFRSSFVIEFTDVDSNNLFSMSELMSFSGVTVFTNFYNGFFPGSGAASIPGITCTSCSLGGTWLFATLPIDEFNANVLNTDATKWSYVVTGLPGPGPNPVPEPESHAMLLVGIGLLGFIARRRRQQAA